MSEKSWDFLVPISFETKPASFTFTSTYLILVLFFCAKCLGFRIFYIWGEFI